MIYAFDNCTLDTELYELRRDGAPVPVEPQVFELLALLISLRDRVVSRDEIFSHIWRDRFVSDSALSSRVKDARKAIGDDGAAQRLIRTVQRRGFRFVGEVREGPGASAPAPPPPRRRRRPSISGRIVRPMDEIFTLEEDLAREVVASSKPRCAWPKSSASCASRRRT